MTEQTTCLIVDDEPLSREVLRKYIAALPDLILLGECADAYEAITFLGKQQVHLLFLDINMPGLTGIAMARSLSDPPLIVFTTAYPQFAVEGFELNALDYLVKPYSFERFLKAVNRGLESRGKEAGKLAQRPKLMVRADKKLYALNPDQLCYVEGQGDYIRLVLEDQRLVVHDTLKSFLEVLPASSFMRIHRSYVINLRKIAFVEGNQVRIGDSSLPVSPAYKERLLERFSAL